MPNSPVDEQYKKSVEVFITHTSKTLQETTVMIADILEEMREKCKNSEKSKAELLKQTATTLKELEEKITEALIDQHTSKFMLPGHCIDILRGVLEGDSEEDREEFLSGLANTKKIAPNIPRFRI